MRKDIIVDRRQFIIMDRPYIRDDFLHIDLSENVVLSFHRELKILQNGRSILLGNAFPTTGKKLQKEDIQIENTPKWSGRWVLIDNKTIVLDACGTLGVYYGKKENGSFVFSSSLHLITDVLHVPWSESYYAASGKGGIFDYYPIPCTPYAGIKKLLPSQCINFNGVVSFRKDYMIPRYRGESVDQLEAKFIEAMSGVMRSVAEEFGDEVWISLTGGYDSRCNAAIAKSSGIQFHLYTALRDSLKDYDLKKARMICRKIGIQHETIDDRGAYDENRAKLFDLHCGGHISFGTERQQIITGSDVPAQSKAVVLWGTLWAMSYYAYKRFIEDKTSAAERFLELQRWSDAIACSAVHKDSLTEWLHWVEQYPMEGMDWRQRLYWEQRNGAWESAAQQALDLLDSIRIAPINCQQLLEILLSYPQELQYSKQKQHLIVLRCCPELASIPYGEPNSIVYRLVRKGIRIVEKLTWRQS